MKSLTLTDGYFVAADSHSVSVGFISIDGHDIRDLNPYWLRSHIGTVSQVNEMSVLHVCCSVQHRAHQ